MDSTDETSPMPLSLEQARREIDLIDDQILELLGQRAEATAQVKLAKKTDGGSWSLPLRPTREGQIMRRLISQAKSKGVSSELTFRLWRAILTDSSLRQAPMTLHVSKHLNSNLANRLRLRDYFGPLEVEESRDEAQALLQLDANEACLCVVETEQNWVEAFVKGNAGRAQVIAVLPSLKDGEVPNLLVIGQAPIEPTGDDETLVISEGKLPRDFSPQPLWQVKVGAYRLSCLPGFLLEREGPLVGLMRSNASLGLKVAGRYSSAIEV